MDRKRKAREIDKRLVKAFGMRLPQERRDVIHELVHAVLSQNTSRRNYNLAYARLIEEFPTVEQLAAAPVGRIERAIKPGGLSRQKSAAIKEILSRIADERGDLSLEFVRDLKVTEAREWLTSLPGVGPKTASVVLMFADGRKVLPVDTHVLRTSKRIGLIDSRATAEKAQEILEEIVPPAIRPRMHLNLVELGREVCHARNPAHEICPVNMLCDYFALGKNL
ncbi:MAG: endonuclease III [Actinobacteria bacterium]|nr:endonuclease III [Actinomycetota bacterium]MBU1943395.1 endonuclease III [Actinomycetota bacterium]MBU2686752.1 endonuclease III [Actinomycetota bacterium]